MHTNKLPYFTLTDSCLCSRHWGYVYRYQSGVLTIKRCMGSQVDSDRRTDASTGLS